MDSNHNEDAINNVDSVLSSSFNVVNVQTART